MKDAKGWKYALSSWGYVFFTLYSVRAEKFTCLLRLKSSSEQDSLRLKPGSGETATLLVTILSHIQTSVVLIIIRTCRQFLAATLFDLQRKIK